MKPLEIYEPINNLVEAASNRKGKEGEERKEERSSHELNGYVESIFNASMTTQAVIQSFLQVLPKSAF